MKKSFLILIIVILILTVLTSCRSDIRESDGETDTGNVTAAPTDVVVERIDEYNINFLTNSGTLIKSQQVKAGEDVLPPNPPDEIGKLFRGWKGQMTDIQSDGVIVAEYDDVTKRKNLVYASTEYVTKGANETIVIGITGNVCFCGLDIEVMLDNGIIEFVGFDETDELAISNYDNSTGIIHLNYVSMQNTTGEFVLSKLKIKANSASESAISISVKSIYCINTNGDLIRVESEIQNGKIICAEVK